MEWGSREGTNDSYWAAQEKRKADPTDYFRNCLDSSFQRRKG